MGTFASVIQLPPEIAPGYHIFVRGPDGDALEDVLVRAHPHGGVSTDYRRLDECGSSQPFERCQLDSVIVSFLYALLESESRLAAATLGLDPGLGVLHVDVPNRDSLACDLMEPVRPQVDAFLVDWITREPLNRKWFFEQSNGNCRLMASFAMRLSQTAPTWGRAVAPWAEYVAHTLWASTTRSKSVRSLTPPTRLRQEHRRAVKGIMPLPSVKVPNYAPICRGCGKEIQRGTRFCSKCAITATRENFDAGRKSAQSAEHLARRASTMRRHKEAIQN